MIALCWWKVKAYKQFKSAIQDLNINNKHPPKKSIENSFAAGLLPLRDKISQMVSVQLETTDLMLEEEYLTLILCTAIAPIHPYVHIFHTEEVVMHQSDAITNFLKQIKANTPENLVILANMDNHFVLATSVLP